jgi:uncharacterized cupin superfamily protein
MRDRRDENETVRFVISGSATLDLEGQTLHLKAGDSWLVPAGTMQYSSLSPLWRQLHLRLRFAVVTKI